MTPVPLRPVSALGMLGSTPGPLPTGRRLFVIDLHRGLRSRLLRMVAALGLAILLPLSLLAPAAAAVSGPTSLADPSVSPRTGVPSTLITFSVTYVNHNGSPPDHVEAVVDGVQYPMHPVAGGAFKDGIVFVAATTSSVGVHAVSFQAADTSHFVAQVRGGTFTIMPPPATPSPTPRATPAPIAGGTTPTPTYAPTPTPIRTEPDASSQPEESPAPSVAPRPTRSPAPSASSGSGGSGSDSTSGGAGGGSIGPAGGSTGSTGGSTGAGGGSTSSTGGSSGSTGDSTGGSTSSGGSTGGDRAASAIDQDHDGWVASAVGSGTSSPVSSPASASTVAEPLWLQALNFLGSILFGFRSTPGPDAATLAPLGSRLPSLARLMTAAIASIGGVTLAAAFIFFGKRRRDGEQPEPDSEMEGAARSVFNPLASAPLVPDLADVPPEEMSMPRWRRPSLQAARKSDPLRNASADVRLSFDRGLVGAVAGHERRLIRYRLVCLLDAPDELRSSEIGLVDEGDEVELLEQRGAYWRVLTPDGRQGWLHRMTLGDRVEDPDPEDLGGFPASAAASRDPGPAAPPQRSRPAAAAGMPLAQFSGPSPEPAEEPIADDVLMAYINARRRRSPEPPAA